MLRLRGDWGGVVHGWLAAQCLQWAEGSGQRAVGRGQRAGVRGYAKLGATTALCCAVRARGQCASGVSAPASAPHHDHDKRTTPHAEAAGMTCIPSIPARTCRYTAWPLHRATTTSSTKTRPIGELVPFQRPLFGETSCKEINTRHADEAHGHYFCTFCRWERGWRGLGCQDEEDYSTGVLV
jgi:hypothetical protein